MTQSKHGTGQTFSHPSLILRISLPFPFRHAQCLCMIPLLSPLPAAALCCCCSPDSPSTAALPLNPSFLTPPRTGTLGSASPLLPPVALLLPALPSPFPRDSPSAPVPALPGARGGLSPLGRFSSAQHVWVLCPAPTSFPHASSR